MSRNGLVLAGYYGFGNAGDELILQSLLRTYRNADPQRVITVLSADPSQTERQGGVRAINRWNPLAWIPVFWKTQTVALGGGGLLQESTGPRNHLYYLSILVLAKALGCTTEIVAIGVDPIRGRLNRAYTRWVVDTCVDRVSVRDDESVQALRETGVTREIAIQPDPVLDLSLKRGKEPPEGLALAVSPQRGRPTWSRDLRHLCRRLHQEGLGPIDVLVLFPKQDEPMAREIANEPGVIRRVRVCQEPLDLLQWIPTYKAVAGSRFHALLLASMVPVPFLGWGPQAKVASLCRRHGRPLADPATGWVEDAHVAALAALLSGSNKSVILEFGKR